MRKRVIRLYVARRLPRRLPGRSRIAATAASRPARWCYGKLPRRSRSTDARTMPPVH